MARQSTSIRHIIWPVRDFISTHSLRPITAAAQSAAYSDHQWLLSYDDCPQVRDLVQLREDRDGAGKLFSVEAPARS